MPAAADENTARPESQPNILLFLAAFPPVDSINERLGSRRQSRALVSAASRNVEESLAAGQLPRSKKVRRKASRGSLMDSLRCLLVAGLAASAWLPATGRDTTPAKIAKPFENRFRISKFTSFQNLITKKQAKWRPGKNTGSGAKSQISGVCRLQASCNYTNCRRRDHLRPTFAPLQTLL